MTWQLMAAAVALAGAALAPAVAGQPTAGIDMSGALPGLPPPADSGKPAIGAPPAVPLGPSETDRCLPALPFQMPAWRW